ncbi:MAG: STAS domain-containing protein [Pseudomonadota bacterium]
MQTAERLREKILVVEPLEPRLDVVTAPRFKSYLVDRINDGNIFLVLNLGRLEFVDSSGLTAIVSTLKTLRLGGGDMTVCQVPKNISQLFKITKLDRVFGLFQTEEEAVRALKNGLE